MTVATSSHVEAVREGRMGVIALNRPEAINALSHDMVRAILGALEGWRDDDSIRAILFEGRGPRGFCAGGDVRAVRASVLAGRPEAADAFFADEYRMNALIAGYGKPVVAIADGIVMGGGIGIAGHADFRFATSRASFGMPEAAIGFFGDVGANAILARAPLHRALALLMTGLPAGAADALALGLADCVIAPGQVEEVRRAVIAAAEAGDVETAIASLMQAQGVDPGPATLCADADALDEEFTEGDAEAIVGAVIEAAMAEPHLARYSGALAQRSPTSLVAIHDSHVAARRLQDVARVLALDLDLAGYLCRQPDFAEGVRAVLVDKTGAPRWSPAEFRGVDTAAIAAIVARHLEPAIEPAT